MAHVLELSTRQGADLFRVPLVDGKGSQSRTVGRAATVAACVKHGLLTSRPDYALTDYGRSALKRYAEFWAAKREREGW